MRVECNEVISGRTRKAMAASGAAGGLVSITSATTFSTFLGVRGDCQWARRHLNGRGLIDSKLSYQGVNIPLALSLAFPYHYYPPSGRFQGGPDFGVASFVAGDLGSPPL